jgi:hypothetical protein
VKYIVQVYTEGTMCLCHTLGKPLEMYEMPITGFSDNAIWRRKIFERLFHLKYG